MSSSSSSQKGKNVSIDPNQANLNRAQVAKIIGISAPQLDKIRRGKIENCITFPAQDLQIGRIPYWKRETIATWQSDQARHTNKLRRQTIAPAHTDNTGGAE